VLHLERLDDVAEKIEAIQNLVEEGSGVPNLRETPKPPDPVRTAAAEPALRGGLFVVGPE
jgi:hypothetical protein